MPDLELNENSSWLCRDLPAGRGGHLCVVPLTFGRARILWAPTADHSGVYDSW